MHPDHGAAAGGICTQSGAEAPAAGGTQCPQGIRQCRRSAGRAGALALSGGGRSLLQRGRDPRAAGVGAGSQPGAGDGGVSHLPGLSGGAAGCGGVGDGVPPGWGAAGGGQCPRGISEIPVPLPASHGSGSRFVLRLRSQDAAGGHGRGVSAHRPSGPGAAAPAGQGVHGAVWLQQPVVSDLAVAGRCQRAVGGLSGEAASAAAAAGESASPAGGAGMGASPR